MSYSDTEETNVGLVGTLLCEVLYCRAEARLLGLEMAEYLLDMARLELEAPAPASYEDTADPERFQSHGI
jgi:hypothetical protein